MLTIAKARNADGGSEVFQVARLGGDGGFEDAVDAYDGTEPLACEVWPGGERAVVATLPASWYDAPAGQVAVDFPRDVMEALEAGSYSARVLLSAEGVELARFRLQVASGPGLAAPRVVYHTYKQLKDEYPWIERLADHLEDETGFNEIAGEARDWIEGEILDAARGRCGGCWPRYRGAYSEALAGDRLDLTTHGGKRLAKASVYYTLAVILRRAFGATNTPDGIEDRSEDYERRAKEMLDGATASFGEGGDPRSVRLGGITFGRLVR